jgi:NADH dehydrogenase
VSGFPAWFVWLFIHLMYLVEFQNRVIVFMQWGLEYLTFSRGALLITGPSATDVDKQTKAAVNAQASGKG